MAGSSEGSSEGSAARRPDAAGVGDRYRTTRLRFTTLLDAIDDDSWDRPVDACPGWRVRDVLAHLVGTVDDAIAGRIAGPPPPALTADTAASTSRRNPSLNCRRVAAATAKCSVISAAK